MKYARATLSPLIVCLTAAAMVGGVFGNTAWADPTASLVPPFGPTGREFTQKAQSGHDIHGWLPKGWDDNSSWAKVSAVYTKLDDAPSDGAGAVRIEFTKRDSHHVQFRPSKGPLEFTKGKTYSVTGWARSPKPFKINVGFRQDEEPREYFDQEDIETNSKWTHFQFDWTPAQDCKAWLLIVVQDPGTVDVAGIKLEEK